MFLSLGALWVKKRGKWVEKRLELGNESEMGRYKIEVAESRSKRTDGDEMNFRVNFWRLIWVNVGREQGCCFLGLLDFVFKGLARFELCFVVVFCCCVLCSVFCVLCSDLVVLF